jgi:gas vesicle protein
MNTKLLVFALFGAAIVMLFTTDKGKEIREELSDAADDWSEKLSERAEKATCSANDLKKLVSKEVSGLSEEARSRISSIIDEGAKSVKKVQKAVTA